MSAEPHVFRLSLRTLDNTASFRTNHKDDPIHDYVTVHIARDTFNALGRPGNIEIALTAITPEDRQPQPSRGLLGWLKEPTP